VRLIDITRPVSSATPVWPGDAPCALDWTARIADGGGFNASALRMGAHAGTHADGPYHVVDGAARIGAVPIEVFVGPAFVVHIPAGSAMDAAWATALLASVHPERLLVRTGAWLQP